MKKNVMKFIRIDSEVMSDKKFDMQLYCKLVTMTQVTEDDEKVNYIEKKKVKKKDLAIALNARQTTLGKSFNYLLEKGFIEEREIFTRNSKKEKVYTITPPKSKFAKISLVNLENLTITLDSSTLKTFFYLHGRYNSFKGEGYAKFTKKNIVEELGLTYNNERNKAMEEKLNTLRENNLLETEEIVRANNDGLVYKVHLIKKISTITIDKTQEEEVKEVINLEKDVATKVKVEKTLEENEEESFEEVWGIEKKEIVTSTIETPMVLMEYEESFEETWGDI